MQLFKRISHLNGLNARVDVNCGWEDGQKTGHLYHTLLKRCNKNVSNGTSPPQGQQLSQLILISMHKCRIYGPDKSERMDARMHIHQTKIVTTMSHFIIGLGMHRLVHTCAFGGNLSTEHDTEAVTLDAWMA